MKYAWKNGSRFKTNPDVAGKVLEDIRDQHGILTPQAVVDVAKNESSDIHSDFEWDDSKAANHYRLQTARQFIRYLRVSVEGEATDEPVFVHVTKDDQPYYEKTSVAVQNPDTWLEVMVEEKGRLSAIEKRLESLIRLENHVERVEQTQKVITAVRTAQEVATV